MTNYVCPDCRGEFKKPDKYFNSFSDEHIRACPRCGRKMKSDIKHGLKQSKKLNKQFRIMDEQIDKTLGVKRIFKVK